MIHIDDVVNCEVRVMDLGTGEETSVFAENGIELYLIFDPRQPRGKMTKGSFRGVIDQQAKINDDNRNVVVVGYINGIPVTANTPPGVSAQSYTQTLEVDINPRKKEKR